MTDDELAEIEARSRVLPAITSSYELSWSMEPLTASSARQPFIPPERRAELSVRCGDTVVLRIENGRESMSTEPHLSSWLRAPEDRTRLLEALHECREDLAEAVEYGEECLRRMGGTW